MKARSSHLARCCDRRDRRRARLRARGLVPARLARSGPRRRRSRPRSPRWRSRSRTPASRATPRRNEDTKPIAVADLFRLAKAMPAGTGHAGHPARARPHRRGDRNRVRQSITPASRPRSSATTRRVPITLAFDGNFYELSDFLFRLRTSSASAQASFDAAGRLFSVESISFAEAPKGFPELARDALRRSRTSTGRVPASAGAPPRRPTTPAADRMQRRRHLRRPPHQLERRRAPDGEACRSARRPSRPSRRRSRSGCACCSPASSPSRARRC